MLTASSLAGSRSAPRWLFNQNEAPHCLRRLVEPLDRPRWPTRWSEGRRVTLETQADLFFVTLMKPERHYSPTTVYTAAEAIAA